MPKSSAEYWCRLQQKGQIWEVRDFRAVYFEGFLKCYKMHIAAWSNPFISIYVFINNYVPYQVFFSMYYRNLQIYIDTYFFLGRCSVLFLKSAMLQAFTAQNMDVMSLYFTHSRTLAMFSK